MDRYAVFGLLLKIVLLISFTSSTLPARLQFNSSPSSSLSRDDNIPIEQAAHSSVVSPSSLYDITPYGEPPSPSVMDTNMGFRQLSSSSISISQDTNVTTGSSISISQNTNVTIGSSSPSVPRPPSISISVNESINVTINRQPTSSPSASLPPSASISFNMTIGQPAFSSSHSPPPSASALFNLSSSNVTIGQPASSSPSPIDHILFGQFSHAPLLTTADITPPVRASRGGLNLLEKIATAVAVIVVSLVVLIAVIKTFKKKRAPRLNDVGVSLGASRDIRADKTGQSINPRGESVEVGNKEIPITHTTKVGNKEIPITYTKKALAEATDNFDKKVQVGEGVSGGVYRANLPGDRVVAVKRATELLPNIFLQELSMLLRLPRHPYLVDLIGMCTELGEQILVFEFISNGSLRDRLHKNKGNNGLINPLPWTARMDIAYQVAVALQYLHDEAKPPILHRDVKSANVLLVNDNSAKLADFGLSKLGPKDNEFTITAVRGSYGYMDPQYEKTRRYSAKSDVYSFGVLLLELITGLKPLHDGTPLAEWTQTYRSAGVDSFLTIVDRTVVEHINTRELQNMIKIANLCLSIIIEERCLMKDIVNMMQETRNINGNGNLSDVAEAPFLENGNIPDGGAAAITADGGGAITAS